MSNKLSTTKKIVPIDQIVANPWNPNQMDEATFEKMKATIKEKGLFGAIYVRPFAGCYEILDGEHRVKACKELGYTELPVEIGPQMTEKEVMFWTSYFNNTHGKDDIEKLAKIFENMDAGQAQLLPFTTEEMENTKELFKFDFSQFEKRDKARDGEKEKVRIIIVDVPEEIFKLWNFCKKYAEKEEGKSDVDLIAKMIEDYTSVRLGSNSESREQIF